MMMAVSFERYGRLYYVDPGPVMPAVGAKVLVPTDGGAEVAQCVWAPQWVDEDVGGLPVCAGLAGDEHLARDEANRGRRAEARVAARRLVREHGLPMKVIGVDYVDLRDYDERNHHQTYDCTDDQSQQEEHLVFVSASFLMGHLSILSKPMPWRYHLNDDSSIVARRCTFLLLCGRGTKADRVDRRRYEQSRLGGGHSRDPDHS